MVFPVVEGVGGGAQLKHFLLQVLSVLATRLRMCFSVLATRLEDLLDTIHKTVSNQVPLLAYSLLRREKKKKYFPSTCVWRPEATLKEKGEEEH